MFSREVTNEYGSYSKKDNTTILLKGVFDKNFIELKTVDPNMETYKVFNCPSQSINFAVKLGNSTYIPQHLFSQLQTAFNESNPYFTTNDLVTIELDLSKTLSFIDDKFNVKVETKQVTYAGSQTKYTEFETKTVTSTITTKSGSVDIQQSAVITSNEPVEKTVASVAATLSNGFATRLELAGVENVEYPFYINNNPNQLNDENIISYIKFVFEESNTLPTGINKIVQYEYPDGTVIVQNLPVSTDVVAPVTQRVFNLDSYLKDVQR